MGLNELTDELHVQGDFKSFLEKSDSEFSAVYSNCLTEYLFSVVCQGQVASTIHS